MLIQPDAKIVQADLGRQASLKPREGMWTLPGQAKSVEEFVKDALNPLAQVSQPPPPLFGPRLFAALTRWGNHLGSIKVSPTLMRFLTSKPLIGDVGALCWFSDTAQRRYRQSAKGQKGFHQELIMAGGFTKAVASDHALPSNGNQQVKTFIPANAVTPANIGLPCQPSFSTSFGIAYGNA